MKILTSRPVGLAKKTLAGLALLLMAAGLLTPVVAFGGTDLRPDTLPSATGKRILAQAAPSEDIKPKLNIQIPTLPQFSDITVTGPQGQRQLSISWIAQYVSAIYRFGVGIAGILAVVMIMIGGAQYITAGGDAARVTAAKQRINDAIIGLLLSLGVYLILNIINPDILSLKALSVIYVEPEPLELNVNESVGADNTQCGTTYQAAKKSENCKLAEKIKSPKADGGIFNCNYHFAQAGYDFTKITAVDYASPFGSAIKAPISGTVGYVARTSGNIDACGNTITITSGTAVITICHAKDFLDDGGGVVQNGKQVSQGDVIGHVGGACCSGQTPNYPARFNVLAPGWCQFGGTQCSGPTSSSACQCQDWMQSGYTSGPHIHMQLKSPDSNLLACMAS